MKSSSNSSVSPQLNRCLGLIQVTTQAIAVVGPTVTAVINIPQVYLSSGKSSWLTYFIACLCILFVSQILIIFAKQEAETAGLASYVRQGLGPTFARLTGWLLLLAYGSFGALLLAMASQSFVMLAAMVGLKLPLWLWVVFLAGCSWWFVSRDVRLSNGMMLALESISIIIILGLCGVILFRHSVRFDLSEFQITATTANEVRSGLMIAFLSFVGFESAATLGGESLYPLRDIPRALRIATLLPGGLFLVWAYVLGLGFKAAPKAIVEAASPLISLGDFLEIPTAALIIGFSACICFFSAGLGSFSALARVGLALGQEKIMPSFTTKIDPRFHTPIGALSLGLGLCVLITLGLLATGLNPNDINDTCGTFGTLALLLVYGLISLSLLFDRYRRAVLTPSILLLGSGTILLLAIATLAFLSGLNQGDLMNTALIFFCLVILGIGLIARQSVRHS
ncbi:MAG: APC family permease [Cyanobacteriota bacterium]|nr:APC family permease [Cyanobacteriota bacterium]